MSNAENIVLALTDEDSGIEGQVDVDHRAEDIGGGISESDTEATVAIPREHRVSIVGRAAAERMAAQDLADAVEKSKQDRRDVYNSLFADDDAASTNMPDASSTNMPDAAGGIVLALTDDDLGIEGQVDVDHTDKEMDGGMSTESDTEATVAIPREHRVSIVGRAAAERIAAKALADAVEKSKKDRRDVYNSLFADDDAASTDMDKAAKTDVADKRIDPKRKENLESAGSSEHLPPIHGRSTSSKGTPITVFPIRAKPCQTDAVESQWCRPKKDGKQKGGASAEKPLPERLYCCSHEITEVTSEDLAKSGKDKQNQAVTSKKQEPRSRIRCPNEKSAKPLLPMTIMRLL